MEHDSINRIEGGLRTSSGNPHPSLRKPLVTVVTVVLNGTGVVEETIRSVLGQTFDGIEFILIDGGSTDGTLDIVRRYDDRIDYWLSEPDKGIYDAMNKGTGLASGEWIIFMNAGDRFYDEGVVARIFAPDRRECDLIYGNHEVNYGGRFSRIMKAARVDRLWQGMICCHQSLFVRTALVRGHGFNTDNAISADFELLWRLQRDGRRIVYLDETVATVMSGGVSDTERVSSIRSQWKVVSSYDGSLKVSLYFLRLIADSVVRDAVKRILPQGLVDRIIGLKS